MEWPKRARTADWENGVLALDREKQFEVPKLTAEIMERQFFQPVFCLLKAAVAKMLF